MLSYLLILVLSQNGQFFFGNFDLILQLFEFYFTNHTSLWRSFTLYVSFARSQSRVWDLPTGQLAVGAKIVLSSGRIGAFSGVVVNSWKFCLTFINSGICIDSAFGLKVSLARHPLSQA